MMPREYNTVNWYFLEKAQEKWVKKYVKFSVVGCELFFHEDSYGNKEWLLCFTLNSMDILQLRMDLGLEMDVTYNPHHTVLEYNAKKMYYF